MSRRNRVRNEDARTNLGVESVLELLERSRLRWFRQIYRMDKERIPKKKMAEMQTFGKRTTGCLRSTLKDGVRRICKQEVSIRNCCCGMRGTEIWILVHTRPRKLESRAEC